MSHISFIEKGQGPPLIFLHGIGGNAVSWQPQLDAFSESYRCLAWDMPGYGNSTFLSSPTFAQYAQCLHDFLAKHNIDNPILVGHSIGGMIIQEYLATWPGVAHAVVLYATSPAFGRKDGEWQQKFIQARLGPLDAGKTMAELAPGIVQELVGSDATEDGLARATQYVATVPEETFRVTMHCLLEFDRRDALGQIDIPCLLLVGEEDTNAPPAVMEKMASKIPSAQFQCVSRLGHWVNVENPTVFNRYLQAFLDRL